MNVFDSIITGLNEAVDYEKGKISAKKHIHIKAGLHILHRCGGVRCTVSYPH